VMPSSPPPRLRLSPSNPPPRPRVSSLPFSLAIYWDNRLFFLLYIQLVA
jgi:hypothetical protein